MDGRATRVAITGTLPPAKGPSTWNSSKGGGKGQGGKPSATQIALHRVNGDPSKAVCPTELRRARCDFHERTGKPCKFMHFKALLASLSSVEGLVATDLSGMGLMHNAGGSFRRLFLRLHRLHAPGWQDGGEPCLAHRSGVQSGG